MIFPPYPPIPKRLLPSPRGWVLVLLAAGAMGLGAGWAFRNVGILAGVGIGGVGFLGELLFVMGRIDRRERERIGRPRRGISRLRPAAHATVEVLLATDDALAAVATAMHAVPGCGDVSIHEHQVNSEVAASGKSFGERLEVAVVDSGPTRILTIRSRPKLRSTLLDFGKNDENVEALMNALQQALDQR